MSMNAGAVPVPEPEEQDWFRPEDYPKGGSAQYFIDRGVPSDLVSPVYEWVDPHYRGDECEKVIDDREKVDGKKNPTFGLAVDMCFWEGKREGSVCDRPARRGYWTCVTHKGFETLVMQRVGRGVAVAGGLDVGSLSGEELKRLGRLPGLLPVYKAYEDLGVAEHGFAVVSLTAELRKARQKPGWMTFKDPVPGLGLEPVPAQFKPANKQKIRTKQPKLHLHPCESCYRKFYPVEVARQLGIADCLDRIADLDEKIRRARSETTRAGYEDRRDRLRRELELDRTGTGPYSGLYRWREEVVKDSDGNKRRDATGKVVMVGHWEKNRTASSASMRRHINRDTTDEKGWGLDDQGRMASWDHKGVNHPIGCEPHYHPDRMEGKFMCPSVTREAKDAGLKPICRTETHPLAPEWWLRGEHIPATAGMDPLRPICRERGSADYNPPDPFTRYDLALNPGGVKHVILASMEGATKGFSIMGAGYPMISWLSVTTWMAPVELRKVVDHLNPDVVFCIPDSDHQGNNQVVHQAMLLSYAFKRLGVAEVYVAAAPPKQWCDDPKHTVDCELASCRKQGADDAIGGGLAFGRTGAQTIGDFIVVNRSEPFRELVFDRIYEQVIANNPIVKSSMTANKHWDIANEMTDVYCALAWWACPKQSKAVDPATGELRHWQEGDLDIGLDTMGTVMGLEPIHPDRTLLKLDKKAAKRARKEAVENRRKNVKQCVDRLVEYGWLIKLREPNARSARNRFKQEDDRDFEPWLRINPDLDPELRAFNTPGEWKLSGFGLPEPQWPWRKDGD